MSIYLTILTLSCNSELISPNSDVYLVILSLYTHNLISELVFVFCVCMDYLGCYRHLVKISKYERKKSKLWDKMSNLPFFISVMEMCFLRYMLCSDIWTSE